MKFPVRLIFGCLIIFISLLLFKHIALAQTVNQPQQTAQPQYMAPNTNSDVPKNLHTYTQSAMLEVMSALLCQLAGVDPINPKQECLGVDRNTNKIGFVQSGGGLLGVTSHMIAMLYVSPVHPGDYFSYLASNFGVAKSSYAQVQGLGFTSLSPLVGVWLVFRNFVYLLFVVIFLVVGVGIMLRVRIDPRTVMTIQNQIPKLIIGIILVTFSFAIAGFLVDLMYVFSYLMINLVASADPHMAHNIAIQLMSAGNPFNAANIATTGGVSGTSLGLMDIARVPANAAGQFFGPLFNNDVGRTLIGFIGSVVGKAIGQTAGTIAALIGTIISVVLAPETGGLSLVTGALLGGTIGAVAGSLIGFVAAPDLAALVISLIAWLIVIIAIIFSLFRLWIQLLICYISIFLDVIFAPVWIAAGLIPGSKIGFGAWLRDITANLSAFPTALTMLLLARVFIDAFGATQTNTVFVAPLIGNPSSTNEIGSLIGLGFILMIPEAIKLVKAALKAPGSGLGKSFFGAVGIGVAVPFNTAKTTARGYFGSRAAVWDVKAGGYRPGGLFGAVRNMFGM